MGQHRVSCPLSTLLGPGQSPHVLVDLTPGLTHMLSKEFTAHEFTLLDLAENVGYGDGKIEF